MCGIAGVVSSIADDGFKCTERMTAALVSRGPDRQAATKVRGSSCRGSMGHARLRIIDLSSKADQPMTTPDGRYTLVFNGEIYNYRELAAELATGGTRFATGSDTEVLLAALARWGEDVLSRLRGMFAFALFDGSKDKLLLVRDRFGVKPLYYAMRGDGIAFASTQTPLAQEFDLRPNLDYCASGLRSWVFEDGSERAPYDGIQSLGAGTIMEVDFAGGRPEVFLRRYYDLEANVRELKPQLAEQGRESYPDRVRGALEDAFALRLKADVPMGVVLSGGVDSSALICLCAQYGARVTGFHFGSPYDGLSDGPVVADIARQTGLEVEYVSRPQGADAMERALRRTIVAQDAPFRSISVVAQNLVYQRARRRGVLVLLGGQGGDEAFMGYHKYQLFRLRRLWRQGRRGKALAAGGGLGAAMVAETLGAGLVAGIRDRYSGWLARQSGRSGSVLRLPAVDRMDLGYNSQADLRERQASDILRFSLPTLLRYEDRNSMGNSVESRLPFMDDRLMELGLALPLDAKVGRGFGKLALRRALQGLVPDSVLWARGKRGFDVNRKAWIADGFGIALRRVISDGKSSALSLLPQGAVVDDVFSDSALAGNAARMSDALALAWMVGA